MLHNVLCIYMYMCVCVCVCVCVCGQLLSHVWLSVTSWTVACQALLSMEFPRQEYWYGLPFPTPGYLLDQGIEPMSLVSPVSPALAGEFFTTVAPGKPTYIYIHSYIYIYIYIYEHKHSQLVLQIVYNLIFCQWKC